MDAPKNDRMQAMFAKAIAAGLGKAVDVIPSFRTEQAPGGPADGGIADGVERGKSATSPTPAGASAKQIEANRANAQKSTGPKTEAGKAKSSLNALKHGLCSKALVLPGEDPAEFTQLTANLFKIYDPDPDEEDLVEQLARKQWMMRRLRAAEREMGQILAEKGKTAARALAEDYMGIGDGGVLRIMNHELRISNSIQSLKRQLAKMQKHRPARGYDGDGIADLTRCTGEELARLLGAPNDLSDESNSLGEQELAENGDEANSVAEGGAGARDEAKWGGSAPPATRVA